jgi:4'-phosphopantetheinyl transferase
VSEQVQVWWAELHHAADISADLMDDVECGRYAALRQEVDRHRFKLGCALLRLIAGATLTRPARTVRVDRTCAVCGGPHGKPRVVDGDGLEVSVSHSGRWVVVAATRGAAIGVDVEQIPAKLDVSALAPTVLSPSERALDAETLLAHWTAKEAVLKATGDGLRAPLSAITIDDVLGQPRLGVRTQLAVQGREVQLYRLAPGPGYVASLAVLDSRPRTVVELDAAPLLTRPLPATRG